LYEMSALRQEIEGGSGPKPAQLRVAEGMSEAQRLGRSISVLEPTLHGFSGCEAPQSEQADSVILPDPVVVLCVRACERQQTLLLSVRFVNARKTAGDHGDAAEQSRAQSCVLTTAALAIVRVSDDHPLHALCAIVTGDGRDGLAFGRRQNIARLARL